MLLTARLVFIHLPKTGGTYVRHTVDTAGIPYIDGSWHLTPDRVLPVVPDRLSFTLVRHPVTWWRSFWVHSARHGCYMWPEEPFRPVISLFTGSSYIEFMTRVLNDAPGEYSRIVERYTDGVKRVGLTERLPGDLASILHDAGYQMPMLPPIANASVYTDDAVSSAVIDAGITAAEQPVITRFYADREDSWPGLLFSR